MMFALFLIYQFRSLLFSGYELVFVTVVEGSQWGGALGICALTVLLVYLADVRDYYVKHRRKVGIIFNFHLLCFAGIAVCIASMGSRTILFLGVISTMVAYTTLVERASLKQILLAATVGVFAFGIIGIWRVNGDFTVMEIVSNSLGESIGTSFSYLNEVARPEVDLFKSPVPFLSLFLNLVPTILLPNKTDLMQTTIMLNVDMYSPFGAENVYLGLMTYFGALGGAFVLFGLGAFVSKLYNKAIDSSRAFAMYTFITACLMTMLFRDPLQGSLVKHIFQVGIVIPLLLTPFLSANRSRQ